MIQTLESSHYDDGRV